MGLIKVVYFVKLILLFLFLQAILNLIVIYIRTKLWDTATGLELQRENEDDAVAMLQQNYFIRLFKFIAQLLFALAFDALWYFLIIYNTVQQHATNTDWLFNILALVYLTSFVNHFVSNNNEYLIFNDEPEQHTWLKIISLSLNTIFIFIVILLIIWK